MNFCLCLKDVFKKKALEAAEAYGLDAEAIEDVIDEGFQQVDMGENQATANGENGDGDNEAAMVSGLLQAFTGNQQSGLQDLFGSLGGSTGALEEKASGLGVDPSLIGALSGILGGGGGGGGGGGFNMGQMLQVVQGLTKGGGGGGGIEGFMSLLSGKDGGGGGGTAQTILQIVIAIATSYFAMQSGKNQSLKNWGDAGAKSSGSFSDWAMNLIKELIFPGKKAKEVIDTDPEPDRPPPGGKDGVKGWFDNHPEIGKMQKDIFDDIFDTTDGDDDDRLDDDPTPVIPNPKGFEPDCSILDHASILFLNNKILLDLRKDWRFCFSTKTDDSRDFEGFVGKIELKGPTLVIIRDDSGNVFGAFTSTSWADCGDSGWMGNGDSFVFAMKPKMAVFYSTGKDDNIMHLSRDHGLGLGGRLGRFGLSISTNLTEGSYHEDVETFDLPPLYPQNFTIDHIEVWALGRETSKERERNKVFIRKPNLDIKSGGQVDMDDLLGQIS